MRFHIAETAFWALDTGGGLFFEKKCSCFQKKSFSTSRLDIFLFVLLPKMVKMSAIFV